MDKEDLKKKLKRLTKDELIELLTDDEPEQEEEAPKLRKRKRGSGHRKRSRQQEREQSTHTISNGSQKPTRRQNSGGRQARRESIEDVHRVNKFDEWISHVKPNSQEARELEEAAASAKRTKNAPKAPRDREEQRILARCRVCGQEDLVSPALVYNIKRYKCNDCAGQAV